MYVEIVSPKVNNFQGNDLVGDQMSFFYLGIQ